MSYFPNLFFFTSENRTEFIQKFENILKRDRISEFPDSAHLINIVKYLETDLRTIYQIEKYKSQAKIHYQQEFSCLEKAFKSTFFKYSEKPIWQTVYKSTNFMEYLSSDAMEHPLEFLFLLSI